jgi:hypothetical protein
MPAPKPEETLKILASRFKEVADLVAENEKLKDALAAYQTKAATENSFAPEPSATPLPTDPEPVDESADGWGDNTPPAEPDQTKPRRSRK